MLNAECRMLNAEWREFALGFALHSAFLIRLSVTT